MVCTLREGPLKAESWLEGGGKVAVASAGAAAGKIGAAVFGRGPGLGRVARAGPFPDTL